MSDLTEFLLARIAEDERAAHRIALPLALTGAKGAVVGPGRVLAECEAKRRIVARALTLDEQAQSLPPDSTHTASFEGQALAWRVALRFLALPYADHPDYREEWQA